jgi:flagellar biosynthesis/type III secretory pathway M-ring protein FliF/YscJ
MNKKKIIATLVIGLIILLILFFAIVLIQKNRQAKIDKNLDLTSKTFTPEFLSNEEKTALDVPTSLKIQAITRNQSGEVMVYKIIRDDSDIVNPKKIN